MRSLLLATLLLLLAAPAAHAAVSVSIRLAPDEAHYGDTTKISGTVMQDGVPLANTPVQLDGKRYPFEDPLTALDSAITGPDGTYSFERELDRNWQFRVIATGVKSERVRAYLFPATTLTYRARSSTMIRVILRYRVPRGVRLEQPTIFYVGPRGRKTAPRVASAEPKRIRAGRYRSTALVRLPAKWKGLFRYAACFRYTGGSGMGNPRASCGSKYRF